MTEIPLKPSEIPKTHVLKKLKIQNATKEDVILY